MGKGRKKIPTNIKAMQGTVEKSRLVENEMEVDLCTTIPPAPKLLSRVGKKEWQKVLVSL